MMLKVLVKIIIDARADALNNDLKSVRAQSEARAVKLVMEDGSSMADMVKAALIKADLGSQYQCIDVSYRDQDFNEDVYISPTSLIESETIYKVVVSRVVETAPNTPSSFCAVAENDLSLRKDSSVRGTNKILPSLMSVQSVKPLNQQVGPITDYYSMDKANYELYSDNYGIGSSQYGSNNLEDKFPQTSSSYVDYLQFKASGGQWGSYMSQEEEFRQHQDKCPSNAYSVSMDMYGGCDMVPFTQYYESAYNHPPSNQVSSLASCLRENPRAQFYGQPTSTHFFAQTSYTNPTQYYYKTKQKKKQTNGVQKDKQHVNEEKVKFSKSNQEVGKVESDSPSVEQGSNVEEVREGEKESEPLIESPEYEPLEEESDVQKESEENKELKKPKFLADTEQKDSEKPAKSIKSNLAEKNKNRWRSYNNQGEIPSLLGLPHPKPVMMRPISGPYTERLSSYSYPQFDPSVRHFGGNGGVESQYPPMQQRQMPPIRGLGSPVTLGHEMPGRGKGPSSLVDLCRKFSPY